MRLGQLSRKVSARSADIIAFLSVNNISIEDDANARVDDQYLPMIYERFAPALLQQPDPVSAPVEEVKTADEPVEWVPSEVATPEVEITSVQDSPSVLAEDNREEEVTVPEVIKAPKVELKGLKVLGKIELPKPKEKEVPAVEADSPAVVPAEEKTEVIKEVPRRRDTRDRRPVKENRPRKNPVALERERQLREAEERKKQEEQQKKEKRRQHYQKRVKTPVPTKAVRIVDEEVSMLSDEAPDQPKTWWGRFKRWLTSY